MNRTIRAVIIATAVGGILYGSSTTGGNAAPPAPHQPSKPASVPSGAAAATGAATARDLH